MNQTTRTLGLAALVVAAWPLASARAQQGGETVGTTPAPAAPTEPAQPAPDAQPAAPAPEAQPAAVDQVPLPLPPAEPKLRKRGRVLTTTVGMEPFMPDLGAEADLISTANERPAMAPKGKNWKYSLQGYLRAPLTVGLGPENDKTRNDLEFHSPPRISGRDSHQWDYLGLAPAPKVQLYFQVSNPWVAGTIILDSDYLNDAGYDNLIKIGGVKQAYVTLKAPELFGDRGGVAWNVGAFSNRYGVAGPRQQSTGYFNTYLFGRTHIAGESLTADVDLTDDLQLIVEHGFGAKIDVMPYTSLNHNPPAIHVPYLPEQGPVPQGSNFVHHAHAALVIQKWLRVAGHYMTSWTPNDYLLTGDKLYDNPPAAGQEGRLTVVGGEIHTDTANIGSGYFGYSHLKATRVLPLADGIEVLYSGPGWQLRDNYFGGGPITIYDANQGGAGALTPTNTQPRNESGTIDSAMFQYIIKLAPLLDRPRRGRDLALAVFAMYNRVHADELNQSQDKIKAGAELQASIFKFLSVGCRYDRVMGNGNDTKLTYNVISPRLIIHTTWLAREYIMLGYSRFFGVGESIVATQSNAVLTPNTKLPDLALPRMDNNLFTVNAVVSF